MASDRTRELATKWRKEFEAKHRGTTLDEEKLATLLDDALVALLDAFERETRLETLEETAKICESLYEKPIHCEEVSMCVEVIRAAAAQPTPEVKK